jgi:hypothetical protein
MKCPTCKRSLTEIDYYGEVLVGCIECNRWGRHSSPESAVQNARLGWEEELGALQRLDQQARRVESWAKVLTLKM